ncbi:hypothetical protein E3N88_42082 [Mikania micrantha]|uniref:Uncharacterized protein n=1 Tax=Mikania micrantha TaxID=192012 RepID=A0A5N6LJM1_9ASTR|nr:hypothetical protein E3N88_42082 [Mikania micrantha]
MLDDWHDYKTICMEFTTDQMSVATVRLLDGSQMFGDEHDLEIAMNVMRFVMEYVSGCENRQPGERVQDPSVEVHENDKKKEEEDVERVFLF